MRIKKIALLMSILLLASSVVSCTETPTGEEETTVDTVDTVDTVETGENEGETTEREARLALPDNLPDKKYDGFEFCVVTGERSDYVKDLGVDLELTGETFNDALYYRNLSVSDRFDIKITGEYVPFGHTVAQAAVMSDDDTYGIVRNQITAMATTATSGIYLEWNTQLPYVDLTQPWYIGNAAEALSVNGQTYGMAGEFCLDILRFTYCMYYNLDLAKDYNLENIFDVVKDGRWTYDYLKMLADTVYVDLNANGVKDFDDRLAISGDSRSAVTTYQYAFDNPIATLDADGMPYISMNREKAHDIVTKLNALYWESIGGLSGTWGAGGSTWSKGNLLCLTGLFENATGYGDLEVDFAVIPYPKYDEEQSSYYTMADGAHSVMMVPISTSDRERTSIIIEALNAETYKTVVYDYYETVLKDRYSRNPESGEMLDLLMEGRVFDFGYAYGSTNGVGLSAVISQLVTNNSNNSESSYASMIAQTERLYNNIIKKFNELAEKLD